MFDNENRNFKGTQNCLLDLTNLLLESKQLSGRQTVRLFLELSHTDYTWMFL